MGKIATWLIGFTLGVISVIAILFGWSLIMAFPVKWLWNYLVPELFNLKTITYGQALAMLLLTGLLFRANITKNTSKD